MGGGERLILLLQFCEQPNILDGDDRLVREGLHQFDLALCEWADLGAHARDHAERHAIAEQRHREHGAGSEAPLERSSDWILLLRHHGKVVDMYRRTVEDRAA